MRALRRLSVDKIESFAYTALFLFALATAYCCAARTQEPSKAQTATKVAQAASALSREEALEIENLQLKFSVLSNQQQQLRAQQIDLSNQYAALVQTIEAGHPGFKLDPQTAKLIPAPKPVPAPKKAGN